jgi:hypothetical protein
MPGNETGRERRSFAHRLGGDLKEELRNTFALLFKTIRVNPVSLSVPSSCINYQFSVQAGNTAYPLTHRPVTVSENPVAVLHNQLVKPTCTVSLSPTVAIRQMPPPDKSVESRQMPLLLVPSQQQPVLLNSKPTVSCWLYAALKTVTHALCVIKPDPPVLYTVKLVFEKICHANRNLVQQFSVSAHNSLTLKQLPLLKRPVPLHRFSAEKQWHFSVALATQAKVSVDKVQLKTVYPPLSNLDFETLQETGWGLLCTPKKDNPVSGLISAGKSQKKTQLKGAGGLATDKNPLFYIVIGVRLDTREPITTTVAFSVQPSDFLVPGK